MLAINVYQEVASIEEAADILRDIAEQLDDGFTSGYDPCWNLEEQEEDSKE